MIGLTRKQRELLDFIAGWIERNNGVCPSYEEMMAGVGNASKSGIHRLVVALEGRGAIRRLPHCKRAIEIILPPAHACPSCTAPVQPSFKFCPDCGHRLSDEAAEVERAAA
jgi:repressor LexA